MPQPECCVFSTKLIPVSYSEVSSKEQLLSESLTKELDTSNTHTFPLHKWLKTSKGKTMMVTVINVMTGGVVSYFQYGKLKKIIRA